VLFAIPAVTVYYLVFAGSFLGTADGSTLLAEAFRVAQTALTQYKTGTRHARHE